MNIRFSPSHGSSAAAVSSWPLRAPGWTMRFDVSLDEEHVFMTLVGSCGRTISLGERVHHYSLLVLARQRLSDARRGIEAGSQGWVDIERLSKMLGLDAGHLNVQIFRARRQILQALPPVRADVVERRRGELRFGGFDVRIVRGSALEAHSHPLPQGFAAVMARNCL